MGVRGGSWQANGAARWRFDDSAVRGGEGREDVGEPKPHTTRNVHGILGSHCQYRSRIVPAPFEARARDPPREAPTGAACAAPDPRPSPIPGPSPPRGPCRPPWTTLLRRVHAIGQALACGTCRQAGGEPPSLTCANPQDTIEGQTLRETEP